MDKETLYSIQKRPIKVLKETYHSVKRDFLQHSTRPTVDVKEAGIWCLLTCLLGVRKAILLKRPSQQVVKETYHSVKRDLSES